jgi:anthranilate/para-aminobenzoate synthase component I
MNFSSCLISPRKLKTSYEKGFVVPLVAEVKSGQGVWQTAKSVISEFRDVFFLDSVRSQSQTARYSYLGWQPFKTLRLKQGTQVLPKLRSVFNRYRGKRWEELPFFSGGAVGCLSYDLAWAFEKLPHQAIDDLKLDRAAFLFVRDLLVFDHQDNKCFLISNLIPAEGGTFKKAFEKASKAIEGIKRLIGRTDRPAAPAKRIEIRHFRPDISKRKFKQMVSRAKRYIEAGDIYQANLSQRFSFEFIGDPAKLYESLREINPSPFSSFLRIGELAILSVSPERLIKRSGELCQTRPIAGTRPRGRNAREDRRFLRELVMSPKERAEHIMLVDLERNDLGRVCEPHSVRVSELMTLEKYTHVTHIVSNVVGRLRKDCDQFDLLRAMFPGGTITGCPKIRSMEIIEELEPFKRNFYTGSIGCLDYSGDMDFNIIIRSIVLYRGKGYLQVGAGIVYDSKPEQEYWETLHKGKALFDALARYV